MMQQDPPMMTSYDQSSEEHQVYWLSEGDRISASKDESESASEYEGDGKPSKPRKRLGDRTTSACIACVTAKTKCDVAENAGDKCRRCNRLQTVCIFKQSPRHKKLAPSKEVTPLRVCDTIDVMRRLCENGSNIELYREIIFTAVARNDMELLGEVIMQAALGGFNLKSLIGQPDLFANIVGQIGSVIAGPAALDVPKQHFVIEAFDSLVLPQCAAWARCDNLEGRPMCVCVTRTIDGHKSIYPNPHFLALVADAGALGALGHSAMGSMVHEVVLQEKTNRWRVLGFFLNSRHLTFSPMSVTLASQRVGFYHSI